MCVSDLIEPFFPRLFQCTSNPFFCLFLGRRVSSSNHFSLPGVCEAYRRPDHNDTPHQPSDAFSFLHFHFSNPQRRGKMKITLSKEATYHSFFMPQILSNSPETCREFSNNMDPSSKQHDMLFFLHADFV